MTKIIRPNQNIEAFASQALNTERTVFNDPDQSDNLDLNINASYKRGWGVVGVNELPAKQDFNASLYTSSSLNTYLFQMGIAEWNVSQEYFTNSITNFNGVLYKANQDNSGNNPSTDNGSNWVEVIQDQIVPEATTTVKGVVEKATQTEMNSGTANKYPDATAVKTYVDAGLTGVGITKYSGATVFNAVGAGAYTDLDLSGVVGVNRALVFLSVEPTAQVVVRMRENGITADVATNNANTNAMGGGTSAASVDGGRIGYFSILTDSSGIIEWSSGAVAVTVKLLTYTQL